jgi:Arc/MetJ-type ribon-helix-helix transcriptional regulator
MKTVMLRLRIEPEFKELLENAVRNGRSENMSELIRKAVLNFLAIEDGALSE